MGNILLRFKRTTAEPQRQTSRKEKTENKTKSANRTKNKYTPSPCSSKILVRALYKFDALTKDDLSFKKGDLLEIESETLLDSEDWISAVHSRNKRSGLIPSNYVVKADSSPKSQDWWFPHDKNEATKVLLEPGYSCGTFLVRESGDKKSYVLSVRTKESTTGDPCVKHFRVLALDDDRGFYISAKVTFSNFDGLIKYYKEEELLGTKLTNSFKTAPPLIPFKQLEVRRDQVRLETKLGSGCFADVWKGVYCKAVNVAVKKLKPMCRSMTPEAFLEEAKIMHQCRHRKLVQLLGVVSTEEPFCIITELMENGSLLDYLRSQDGKALKFDILIDINAQVADGMSFLENLNLIHRDLRAANVLVGQNNNVKVADFGLARLLSEEGFYEATPESKFPYKWTALEAIQEHVFSVKSDVWSFGVLMYEIITYGAAPYPGMSNADVVQQVDLGYRLPIPQRFASITPSSYHDMMLKCWKREAEERPTFASLHDFFSDYFVSTEPTYKDLHDMT